MNKNPPPPPIIGFDLMGSDTSAWDFLDGFLGWSDLKNSILLFGNEEHQKFFEQKCPKELKEKYLSFYPVAEEISMGENPLFAVRRKKNSSINEGMKLLQESKIAAFVSCGNTGALVASAKMHLPMLTDIPRPSLLALVPSLAKEKKLAVLDVGANIQVSAHFLTKLALIGYAYQKVMGIEKPRLGLLNIGSEEKKGTPELKKAYETLKRMEKRFSKDFHFIGNVESTQVFCDYTDVLITDGFTGNIFLKTAEGTAHFLSQALKTQESQNLLQHLQEDYRSGALLLGIKGLVVKCHGSAQFSSIKRALHQTETLLHKQFMSSFTTLVSSLSESWN